MELWIDLLFGNWIGILRLAAVSGTLATGALFLTMIYKKSHEKD
jgi:hypothetical protein